MLPFSQCLMNTVSNPNYKFKFICVNIWVRMKHYLIGLWLNCVFNSFIPNERIPIISLKSFHTHKTLATKKVTNRSFFCTRNRRTISRIGGRKYSNNHWSYEEEEEEEKKTKINNVLSELVRVKWVSKMGIAMWTGRQRWIKKYLLFIPNDTRHYFDKCFDCISQMRSTSFPKHENI